MDGFLKNTDSKNFHRAVKCLLGDKFPPRWMPEDMYPVKPPNEVAEILSGFFNGISQEYDPLNVDEIPKTFNRELPIIIDDQVVKMLKTSKKS